MPSGRVVATRPDATAARSQSVAFRNVPAYVIARGVPAAGAEVDVAFGGAIYAFAPAERWGLRVVPDALADLIAVGRRVKHALDGTEVARHPGDERLSGIYGTVLYEELGPAAPAHRRDLRRWRGGPLADRFGDLGPDRAAGR